MYTLLLTLIYMYMYIVFLCINMRGVVVFSKLLTSAPKSPRTSNCCKMYMTISLCTSKFFCYETVSYLENSWRTSQSKSNFFYSYVMPRLLVRATLKGAKIRGFCYFKPILSSNHYLVLLAHTQNVPVKLQERYQMNSIRKS